MAADTQIQRALARPDPMLNFKWEVVAIPGDAIIDTSYIESFEIPFSNTRITNVFMGGGYDYFPEFHDTSSFAVTFYADSKGLALKYLWNWKQEVKDFVTGRYNLPSQFKRDWSVNALDTTGSIILTITYHGCWPADTNNITFDQEGSSRVTLSQTFSVDSMEITFKK